jgi:hypothetical protein
LAGPSWLRWLSAAVFLAVAGYCVVRLVVAQRAEAGYPGCHRALDVSHLLMALGMAVMCSPVGGPVPAVGWQTVFLLITAWFAGSIRRTRRIEPVGWHGGGAHHAAAALAMVYMLSAMPHGAHDMSSAWMAAHQAGLGLAPVGWAFAVYFAGCAVLLGRQLLQPVVPPGPPVPLAPRIATSCQLIMALGMGYLSAPLG